MDSHRQYYVRDVTCPICFCLHIPTLYNLYIISMYYSLGIPIRIVYMIRRVNVIGSDNTVELNQDPCELVHTNTDATDKLILL